MIRHSSFYIIIYLNVLDVINNKYKMYYNNIIMNDNILVSLYLLPHKVYYSFKFINVIIYYNEFISVYHLLHRVLIYFNSYIIIMYKINSISLFLVCHKIYYSSNSINVTKNKTININIFHSLLFLAILCTSSTILSKSVYFLRETQRMRIWVYLGCIFQII